MADCAAPPLRHHRFAPEILRAVRARQALDNWHGPLEILEHWLVVALSTGTSLWAWEQMPSALAAAIYLMAVHLIGGRQRALAGVLHQACHGTLMRNAKLGRILGAFLGGYPVLQSFTGYRASHVRDHHGLFGDPRRDPDYMHFLRNGLYGEHAGRAALRSYLLRALGPRGTIDYVRFLVRHRILNPDEQRWEARLRLGLLLVAALAGAVTDAVWVVLLYWLVPLVTTQVWIGSLAELLEHYPLMERAQPVDIEMARNREFGRIWSLLLGEKHGEGYHLVHHLFPRVPLWRLQDVHRILLQDESYARLARPRGPMQAVRAILRSLPEGPMSTRIVSTSIAD